MIPQITEIEGKFPKYATLSTATATLVDMGDKTITAQVKIDGSIVPDFSYDWEIEYRGERYIHPLRKPQATKSNESIQSVIDIVFHHWATYQLKRFFFVEMATLESGTAMANNYVFPIGLTLAEFVDYLQQNLDYYYGGRIKVDLNKTPDTPYSEDKAEWSFNYTHIWDAVTQINEKYDVRWVWAFDANADIYTLKIGYTATDISHVFEYGYEKGLTRIERQVQDGEIRNQMFGRGGSQNLPYRYFKKFDPNNTSWKADPDWIPELENIYFAELRGKTFRDYVRGWKTNPNRDTLNNLLQVEEYDFAYGVQSKAYNRGHLDKKFSPIEYVEDTDSIAKYGLIQGGLDNNEEIYPTIQKRVIEGLGRVDEVVDVETILVDEPTSNGEATKGVLAISDDNSDSDVSSELTSYRTEFVSSIYQVPLDRSGNFIRDFEIQAIQNIGYTEKEYLWTLQGNELISTIDKVMLHELDCNVVSFKVVDADTNTEITNLIGIKGGTRFIVVVALEVSNFYKGGSEQREDYPEVGLTTSITRTPHSTCSITTSLNWELDYTPIHGIILGNYTEGVNRISGNTTIPANGTGRVELLTEIFEVDEDGVTNVDVPTRIISSDTTGSYSPRKIIDAINVDTNEAFDPSNLSEGKYRLRVITDITNLTTASQTYKVELLPAYIYYPYDSAKWRPTFDIWIKDIWGSTRLVDANGVVENDTSYAERVWRPILGDRQGDEAKVVFSSGLLSGHSDYEFPIVAFAYDNTKSLDGVSSHWRLTLAKSDADVEATGKWLPSIAINAKAGDYFYFIGIDMPHQYVLWAEEEVDKWKRENMPSEISPTWVVSLDKVRVNTIKSDETITLLSQIEVGAIANFKDKRFTEDVVERRHIQSCTISWNDGRIIPDIEVVLSDKSLNTKNALTEINTSFKTLSADINDLRVSTIETSYKVRKVSKKADNAENVATKTSVKVDGFDSRIANAETMASTAQTKAASAENAANNASEKVVQFDTRIGTLETGFEGVSETAETASKEASEAKTLASNASNSVTTFDGRISTLEGNVGGFDGRISTLENDFEGVKTTATNADAKAQEASDKVADIETTVGEYDGRIEQLETDFENVETIATDAETKAAKAEGVANNASDKVDGFGATVTELNTKVGDLENDFAEVQQTSVQTKNIADEAKETAERANKAATDTSTIVTTQDLTIKTLRNEVAGIKDDYALKTEIEGLATQESVNALGQTVRALDTEVDKQGGKITALEGTVVNLNTNKADKTDITALAERVTTNESAIANKADKSEVTSLSNNVASLAGKVKTNEDSISENSSAIKLLTTNLNNKVDKVTGKGLSAEDFTTALKTKLENLKNYDDTAISNAIAGLQTQLDTLVGDDADDAINKFNEIVAFLEGIKESDDLNSIIASIEQQIAGKQDTITDLSTIRANANAGAQAKTDVDALEPRVTAVEEDVATAQENIERNTERIGSVLTYVNNLATRVGTAETDIDNIEDDINGINAQIATKADTTTVNAQINSITARVDAHETDIRDLENNKVDKVNGKGLSTNDYTDDEKNKLAGIAEGAEVNVQSDWNATSGDAFIKNKPSIPTKTSDLNNDSDFATTAEVTAEVEALSEKVDERVTPIETKATTALNTANTANTNANTALSRATTAINTANAAQNTANQKLDADDVTADIVKPMATGTALSDVSESGVLSAKIDYLRGNRLAFLDPSEYIIEKSVDGGATWETLDSSLVQHRQLFTCLPWTNNKLQFDGTFGQDSKLRITILPNVNNSWRGGLIEFVAIKLWENGRDYNVKVEYCTKAAQTNWILVAEKAKVFATNPSIFAPTCVLSYGKEFGCDSGYGMRFTVTNLNAKTHFAGIMSIGAYSREVRLTTNMTAAMAMPLTGHLYSWDYLQNVEFPNQVKAKSIYATDSITSAGNISAVGKMSATGSLSGYSLALTSGSKNALLYSDGSPVGTSTLLFDSNQIRQIQGFAYVKNGVWPVPAAQIGVYRANRLAFLSDDEFKVEMSTDSGATWVEQTKTDNLRKLFCGMNSGYVSMTSKPTNQMRITLTPTGSRYTYIEWFYLYFGGPYASDPPVKLKCEYAIGNAPDTWILYRDNIPLEGQNGPNMFYFGQMIAHGSTLPKNVRFTITCSVESSTNTKIFGIEGHGRSSISTNAMANWDHLYTTNPSQDAIFPAKVQGTDFVYADGSTVAEYVRGKIDEVNANIAKKLPLPSMITTGGYILTRDRDNGSVYDTGKFFATSLQYFDANEPDAIPNCDLVQQYVAQSIPTEIATAPQKETPYSQRVTIFPNRVYHINEGQTTTGTEIININTTGANAGYDNIWKARLSVGMGIGTTRLVFLVDSIETNIKWKDGVAPTYQSTGGELELTFVQFGGLWLGGWKLFNYAI